MEAINSPETGLEPGISAAGFSASLHNLLWKLQPQACIIAEFTLTLAILSPSVQCGPVVREHYLGGFPAYEHQQARQLN